MDTNGHAQEKHLPAIAIGFDAETQTVHLQFDNQEFKTWDYILSVLEMARLKTMQLKGNAEEALRRQAVHEQRAVQQILHG